MSKQNERIAPLSFHNAGSSYTLDNLASVFQDFVDINGLDVAKFTPSLFERSAKLGATHTLKLLNSNVKNSVLKIARRDGIMPRLFHAGDATAVPAGKIIYRPIAVDGFPQARSIADHILREDDSSQLIFESFITVFGQQAFDIVYACISKPASAKEELYHEAFPIVYVPGPDGRELQLTPIVSIETHANMRSEIFPPAAEEGQKKRFGQVSKSEISSKPQNITGAIAPTHVRMRAEFPEPMTVRQADIFRVKAGGYLPALPQDEVKGLLELYAVQYTRLVAPTEGEQYIRFTEERMDSIANRIIDVLEEHLNEIEALCKVEDANFKFSDVNPIGLLTGRLRMKEEEIALIGRALRGKNFTASLQARGF